VLREEIIIESEVTSYDKRIGNIHQEIKSAENGEIKAIADFKIGLFDMKSRKLIAPTEKWLKAIDWQPV
jgi:acyl-CoA thioesterase FadM